MNLKYFKMSEFVCPCCGVNVIQPDFVRTLDFARYLAGVPFRVTSGYRCPAHNRAVGGVVSSSHVKGLAADIQVDSSAHRYRILYGAIIGGIKRIGVGKGFIHLDMDGDKPQRVLWTYY